MPPGPILVLFWRFGPIPRILVWLVHHCSISIEDLGKTFHSAHVPTLVLLLSALLKNESDKNAS